MAANGLVLGLDSSTQSLSAVLIDPVTGSVEHEYAVSYRHDARLNCYGIDFSSMVIPPREFGEADQPPAMFLASLEALFSDLRFQGVDLGRVRAINISAQQHGHVYLHRRAGEVLGRLAQDTEAGWDGKALPVVLEGLFSYPGAPIWKTANTMAEADWLRERVGGKEAMIRHSGSDSPLRFSGAVVRRVATRAPMAWEDTSRVLLINAFLNGVLTADPDQPTDFGNGSGTSWMDYQAKDIDPVLLDAIGGDLPGGREALRDRLGPICHPLDRVGTVAPWFVRNYGFSSDCAVIAGSGDNPQSKVLLDGDLLSLGTSFVYMCEADATSRDWTGAANSMYDGLGRPFVFACRTNGALVWDRIRSLHGLDAKDFASAEAALAAARPGSVLRLWQPDAESFPASPAFDLVRQGDSTADFAHDYPGLVDSALAIMWQWSKPFDGAEGAKEGHTLYLTGGPSASKGIAARVAALWKRPVQVIGGAGAALGAAVAAAAALAPESERTALVTAIRSRVLDAGKVIHPDPALVEAWHGRTEFDKKSPVEVIVEAYGRLLP